MSGHTVQIELSGLQELLKRYQALGAELPGHVSRVLYVEAEKVMTEAKMHYVPVVTGTLRASGRVHLPVIQSGLVVEQVMGFGGPAAKYAFRVHENPRSGRTKGLSPKGRRYKRWSRVGQWKYLETPAARATPKVMRALEAALARALGRR